MNTSVQTPDKMNAREIYSPSRTRNSERKQLKNVKIAIPCLQTKKMNRRALINYKKTFSSPANEAH